MDILNKMINRELVVQLNEDKLTENFVDDFLHGDNAKIKFYNELEKLKAGQLNKKNILNLARKYKIDKKEAIRFVKEMWITKLKENKLKESGILYQAGVKKYGKDGMAKILSAAGKKKSHAAIGAIKDKYEKGTSEGKLVEQTGVIWKDTKKYKIQKPPRGFAKKAKMGAMIHFTGPKSGAKGETWSKVYQDEWMAIHGEGVKGDTLSSRDLDKKLESHGRVQIKEQSAASKKAAKGLTVQNASTWPDLSEWWLEPKDKIMSFAYYLKGQIPPSKKADYEKNWKKIVIQLNDKYPAPTAAQFKRKLSEQMRSFGYYKSQKYI